MANTQFWVSGPCFAWVGLGSDNSWLFFGFSESGVTVALTPSHEDIQVDYAGTMPGAVSFLGEEFLASGIYTRYDESVMQKIVSWKGPNGVAGSGGNNVLGSLVYEEGLSYPLLLYSPYSFKNQYGGMVPGFNVPNAIHSESNRRTLSVRRTAPEVGFRGLPIFGTVNGSSFSPNTAPFNAYVLYTNVMPNPLPGTD